MKTLEDKIKVMQAALEGEQIEILDLDNTSVGWSDTCGEPGFFWDRFDYRVKEVPLTKPSINWDHVHPDFKWLARDKVGTVFLYQNQPTLIRNVLWDVVDGIIAQTFMFASLDKGTCDWKDSLVERPKGDVK